MRNKATVVLALIALSILLPAAATATVICDVEAGDPGMITVTVTVDDQDPIDGVRRPMEENATTSAGDCHRDFLPYLTCVWTATQNEPGPSSVTAFFSQDGGETFQPCGPFDNDDGLPVELVELSVE